MIKSIAPSSKVLSKYIECYYFFDNNAKNLLNYIAFPHTNTCISFIKGVEIQRYYLMLNIQSKENSGDKVCVEITGKYTQPFFVNYKGNFDEISIVFKPLGVNHFLEKDLIEHAPKFSQPLNLENWQLIAKKIFELEDFCQRIELLENFLSSNLIQKDVALIEKSIVFLEDLERNYAIQDISKQCGVSVKTLERAFNKLLTCSPATYKRIFKFRYSISRQETRSELMKLIDIAYESNYYDQSYFIREYKKLTGLSPKSFFQRISKSDGNKIIWQLR